MAKSELNYYLIKSEKFFIYFIGRYVHAYVTIYFKEDHFIESKRSELYGWVNFLSNCGGSPLKI